MLETLLPSLPAVVLTIAVMLGGLWVFRRAYVKQLGEMQERVIATYKSQNEAQEKQIAACEKEIARLKRVVATIQYALKRRGLRIEIDGESITLIDDQSRQTRTVQILMTDKDEALPDEHEPAP